MYDLKPYLKTIDRVIARGPYTDSWESLASYRVPQWYQDAKFGIFIHWGIYSVPAFGSEWYSRNMYIQGSPEYEHHIKTYGRHSEFGYQDFIPLFRAERFNAGEWAELFQSAGAKYVVPVAEHHDGFQMYRSGISRWNAWDMGPKRDILGELRESCRSRGMQFGASSHRMEHWFFMGHGKEFDSDIREPLERGDFYWPSMPEPDWFDLFGKPEPTEEYLQDWLVRTCELIDSYAPCHVNGAEGFRVAIALPRGTNTEKPEIATDRGDSQLLWARNKWLLAHPDSAEAKQGAYVGLSGENIDITNDIKNYI